MENFGYLIQHVCMNSLEEYVDDSRENKPVSLRNNSIAKIASDKSDRLLDYSQVIRG